MKGKTLIITFITTLLILLVWCNKKDTEILKQYPIGENLCTNNDWKIMTDYKWTPICIFWWMYWWWRLAWIVINLEYMEQHPEEEYFLYGYGKSACEYASWHPSQNDAWEEICIFGDNESCYIKDLLSWNCEFWEDINPYLSIWRATFYCEKDWWYFDFMWEEYICNFGDSYCYLRDFIDWMCKKWDVKHNSNDI